MAQKDDGSANLSRLTQKQAAWLLQSPRGWLTDRAPRNDDFKTYNGQLIVAAYYAHLNGVAAAADGDMPPKERLALANAQLKELQLLEKRGQLEPREAVEQLLMRLSQLLKRHQETMQRDYGPAGYDAVGDLLIDVEREVDVFLESEPEFTVVSDEDIE